MSNGEQHFRMRDSGRRSRLKYFPKFIIDHTYLVLTFDVSAKCQSYTLLTVSQLLANHINTRGRLLVMGLFRLTPVGQLR